MSTALGQALFLFAYFLYKRHVEAPWASVVREELAVPGSLAIDVGANVGFQTMLMAEGVGGRGRVVAFEPEALNRRLLERVVRRKKLANVTIVGAALGARQGTTSLYLNPDHPGDHRTWQARGLAGTQATPVPLTTLDHYLEQRGETLPVSLVKIDVQGAELQVLQGMRGTLSAHARCQVIMEFDPDLLRESGDKPEEVIRFCKELGFGAFLLSHPPRLRPIPWDQVIDAAKVSGYVDLLLSRQVPAVAS